MNLDGVLAELSARRRSTPDMKVATMSVVAYFAEQNVGEWARDRLQALAHKHPSRAIVLDGTREPGAQVGSEDWIELGVAGMTADVAESAVATLRLPEAPGVLIWVATGVASDARFEALARNMHTIVFNTSVLTFDETALAELVAFKRAGTSANVADLAYLRLYPWQEAIAHFFDAAHLMEEAENIEHVEIVCGSDPEAFYLLGWLASRLGWTPDSASSFSGANDRRIEYAIVREGLPRRIRRVELKTAQTRFLAEIDDERADAIMIGISGAHTHPGRARPINNIDLAALVERAILSARHDKTFNETLLAAGDILDRRKG